MKGAMRERTDIIQQLRPHWSEALRRLWPSEDTFAWAQVQPSYESAWESCERADRLLEIAARCSPLGSDEHRRVVLGAAVCARSVLGLVPENEPRPRLAIEAAERWGAGAATPDEVWSALMLAWGAAEAYETAGRDTALGCAVESAARAADSVLEERFPREAAPLAASMAHAARRLSPHPLADVELANAVRSIVRRPRLVGSF